MTPIAWTPLTKPLVVPIVAIHAHPHQTIDRDTYLSHLSTRIQRMVNDAPDPRVAVNEFVETLFEEGLLSDTGHCPVDQAGTNLILSNSRVWDVLANLMVFEHLRKAKLPLVTNLMAYEALQSDLDDPVGRLKSWAGGMARYA